MPIGDFLLELGLSLAACKGPPGNELGIGCQRGEQKEVNDALAVVKRCNVMVRSLWRMARGNSRAEK